MAKQKHRNESREIVNYHRLSNIGQLVIKMNEQLDFIQALCLMDIEERASIRKALEEQNADGKENSGPGEESGHNSEQAGELGEGVES